MSALKEATFGDPEWEQNKYVSMRNNLQLMINGEMNGFAHHPKCPVIDRSIFVKTEAEFKAIHKRLPKA